MIHTFETGLGGARQLHQLPHASGPRVLPGPAVQACATRHGEHPHRPAVPPIQLHYLEPPVTTRSRPEGAATRQPGQWPAGCGRLTAQDSTWLRLQAERARREMVLESVRAAMEEQPSERAVRSAGRLWFRDLVAIVNDVANAKREAA